MKDAQTAQDRPAKKQPLSQDQPADQSEKNASAEESVPQKSAKKSKQKQKSKKFNKIKTPLSAEEQKKKKRKKIVIIVSIVVAVLLAAAAVIAYFIFFAKPTVEEVVQEEIIIEKPKYYSKLSGLEIESESLNNSPTYCIQIPNGLDGARPQVGLDQAPIVFEAIAEAGITRFAAVFQNATSSALGPIRSLRSYYLDWDAPFDCTVVHAGGSSDAVARVSSGNYRDLTESYTYMWRDYNTYYAPNNLMTSPALLNKFAQDNNYTSSAPLAFPRLRPDEVSAALALAFPEQTSSSDNAASDSSVPVVTKFNVNFGYTPAFNVTYQYDKDSNSYLRSYANGQEHIVYSCPSGLEEPSPKSDCGVAKQLSPSAVAVMLVDEYLDTDGYHQVIQTIGTGTAYVFQNGTVIKGAWTKNSVAEQISFKDESGNAISFTPGQLFISAVPNSSGDVEY